MRQNNDLNITIRLKNAITNEITTESVIVSAIERTCLDPSELTILRECDIAFDSVAVSVSLVSEHPNDEYQMTRHSTTARMWRLRNYIYSTSQLMKVIKMDFQVVQH